METLGDLAKSAGIELPHFCSNVLTDYVADNRRLKPLNGHVTARTGEANQVLQRPDKNISEMDLIKEIVMILKKKGGAEEKAVVEKIVFESNESEFSKAYWQAPVGGGVPRWQKNTQFARNSACKMGLVKPPEQSGRGIWELTEKGRKWKFE